MRFEIVGHRGAPRVAPENTMVSFQKAIELGADAIEFDVHQTRDKAIVVMHDKSLWRTTGHPGNINQYTLKKLKRLDAGFWFGKKFKNERIPTIEEVLELEGINFYIELKEGSPTYDGIEDKVVEIIEDNNLRKRCVVISFKHSTIDRIKEINKRIKTGKIAVISFAWAWKELLENADYLCMFWASIDRQFVEKTHKEKRKVNAWTVNNISSLRYIIENGVDAITTEAIDTCIALRREYGVRESH